MGSPVHDVLKSRRRNILSQIYPEYVSLLDNPKIIKPGENLFGSKFMEHLLAEAKTQSTLVGIHSSGSGQTPA